MAASNVSDHVGHCHEMVHSFSEFGRFSSKSACGGLDATSVTTMTAPGAQRRIEGSHRDSSLTITETQFQSQKDGSRSPRMNSRDLTKCIFSLTFFGLLFYQSIITATQARRYHNEHLPPCYTGFESPTLIRCTAL